VCAHLKRRANREYTERSARPFCDRHFSTASFAALNRMPRLAYEVEALATLVLVILEHPVTHSFSGLSGWYRYRSSTCTQQVWGLSVIPIRRVEKRDQPRCDCAEDLGLVLVCLTHRISPDDAYADITLFCSDWLRRNRENNRCALYG
jgi:hypothetical protein